MPLVRAWMRGLSGASGAAILVPGGIFAALLLLALTGSFGRLGGLGQAFTGPAAPGSSPVIGGLSAPSAHRSALLPLVSTPGGVAAAAVVAPAKSVPAGGIPSTGAHTGGTTGTQPNRAGGVPTTGPGSPPPPTPPGCGSACNQPTRPPSLIDRVVALGTSVTSKLPGALGKLTTQMLQQVGATVDRVLPTDRRSNIVRQLGSTLAQLKLP